MKNEHVLSGLMTKRSELSGKIECVQMELRQLIIDLDSLDATIRLFDPDIDLLEIKPKPLPARNTAFRGEIQRIILDRLRKADSPLPTHELVLRVMASRTLNVTDKPLMRVMVKRVNAALRYQRVKGFVRSVPGPNRTVLWEIAR